MASSFHALLAIDAEDFSRNQDAALPSLHTEIRQAVEGACDRSGLGNAWRGARVQQHQGDSLFAVLPQETAIPLIHPFGQTLQTVLAENAPGLRTNGLRLRLRVALHVGLVDDERPAAAGISAATNDVHRLLECQPLKTALADSDPDVTFAALIVSTEMFNVYVRGGHTDLRASQFTEVRAKVKQFEQAAYLHVPAPSRRPPADGSAVDEPEDPPGADNGGVSVRGVSVKGDGNQSVFGNRVGGDVRQTRS